MKQYFKQQPPDNLILKSLESIGLTGFSDFKWVSESFLNYDLQKQVIDEIQLYYFPCNTKLFIKEEMTYSNYITIVRQLLRTKGFVLERKTSRRQVTKNVFIFEGNYRIIPGETLEKEITVTFD